MPFTAILTTAGVAVSSIGAKLGIAWPSTASGKFASAGALERAKALEINVAFTNKDNFFILIITPKYVEIFSIIIVVCAKYQP